MRQWREPILETDEYGRTWERQQGVIWVVNRDCLDVTGPHDATMADYGREWCFGGWRKVRKEDAFATEQEAWEELRRFASSERRRFGYGERLAKKQLDRLQREVAAAREGERR